MSKHEKQIRRERRKGDRARCSRAMSTTRYRQSEIVNRKSVPAALAAAAAIASGTAAYAVPVRFDNPPEGEPEHFEWNTQPGNQYLDIRLDAASQPGEDGTPGNFRFYDGYYGDFIFRGHSSSRIQGNDNYISNMLVGASSGELIPMAGLPFNPNGYIFSNGPNDPYSLLPEGIQTYLGVRFDIGDGNLHYGWIGVARQGQGLDLFAWGFESEPGVSVPAGAPEPASLALLALGAARLMRRRQHLQ